MAGCSSLRLAKIRKRRSFPLSACLFLRSCLWLAAHPRQGALPSGSQKSISAGLFTLLRFFIGHASGLLRVPGQGALPSGSPKSVSVGLVRFLCAFFCPFQGCPKQKNNARFRFSKTNKPPAFPLLGRKTGGFSLSKKATYRWSFSRIRKGNAV